MTLLMSSVDWDILWITTIVMPRIVSLKLGLCSIDLLNSNSYTICVVSIFRGVAGLVGVVLG